MREVYRAAHYSFELLENGGNAAFTDFANLMAYTIRSVQVAFVSYKQNGLDSALAQKDIAKVRFVK